MTRHPAKTQPLDPDVLDCLLEVMDPEVGLSVVDLGLVYRATRGDNGIAVALTLTTRACPLGEMIVEDARERLARRFQDGRGSPSAWCGARPGTRTASRTGGLSFWVIAHREAA